MARVFTVLSLALLLASPVQAAKPKAARAPVQAAVAQDVVLRHMLSGPAGEALTDLVLKFNDEQQGKVRVVLQDVRGLDEAQLKAVPTLALLEPDDSRVFFDGSPRFKPLYQVMALNSTRLEARQFFPLIADAVSDPQGRIQALPLGMSLPVLIWNKSALGRAGLDAEAGPSTWFELQQRAGVLHDAGDQCPLTSSRFSWVHLENVAVQQGEALAIPQKKGHNQARMNNMVGIKHLALLSSWYKARYFRYYGPGAEADSKFLAGECSMLTGESSLYTAALRSGLSVGMAPIPYYDDMYGADRNKMLPGGVALWALEGRDKTEYRSAAKFVDYLMRPATQASWLQQSGYLPMTGAAVHALKGREATVPLLDLALRQLVAPSPAKYRIRHNFGLAHLRGIVGEEVGAVWANLKPAKLALDTAMLRANTSSLAGE